MTGKDEMAARDGTAAADAPDRPRNRLAYARRRRRRHGRVRDATDVWVRLAVLSGLATIPTLVVGAALTGAGHGTYSVLYLAGASAFVTAVLSVIAVASHRAADKAARRRAGGPDRSVIRRVDR